MWAVLPVPQDWLAEHFLSEEAFGNWVVEFSAEESAPVGGGMAERAARHAYGDFAVDMMARSGATDIWGPRIPGLNEVENKARYGLGHPTTDWMKQQFRSPHFPDPEEG